MALDNEGASSSSDSGGDDDLDLATWPERYAARVATRPCLHFWTALLVSLAVGVVGLVVGDFTVDVDNSGWYSRGTPIANRAVQFELVDVWRDELFADPNGDLWDQLQSSNQELPDTEDDDRRRRLAGPTLATPNARTFGWDTPWKFVSEPPRPRQFSRHSDGRNLNKIDTPSPFRNPSAKRHQPAAGDWLVRRLRQLLLDTDENSPLAGCQVEWYNSSKLLDESRLWPVYQATTPSSESLWDGPALQDMCEQERVTQAYLEANRLCGGCANDQEDETYRCLWPYSPVLMARVTVPNGLTLSCADLARAWSDGNENSYQRQMETDVLPCVERIKTDYNPDQDGMTLPDGCPSGFFPHMVDEAYGTATGSSTNSGGAPTTTVRLASAIYATDESHVDDMYDAVGNFGYGDGTYMRTYYDTQNEDFVILATDEQVLTDMTLAVSSAFITFLAMVIHTRSPFLASVGLLQIVLSFPLAYFVYYFIARLRFFPFLNFIGIFVIFALGADDVFVAVDKWKNARLARPHASVQEIAAASFPDAAGAMLLTTLTTAVAFFGTAVCPVAPILAFAVFVGLLVVADYVLCCLLVFPALVIYDQRMQAKDKAPGCCCHCSLRACACRCFSRQTNEQDERGDVAETEDADITADPPNTEGEGRDNEHPMPSLIHRILDRYYSFLHRFRWILLVICAGALVVSAVKAAQIKLPTSADVRLFDEEDNQYEANYIKRQEILFDTIEKKVGSTADVMWGVIPADTGNQNNPQSWTKLMLDPNFTPSQEDVQVFLRDFCDHFFEQDFAAPIRTDYQCPLARLDAWLAKQANATSPASIYEQHCADASGLPIPSANFDACAYAWSQDYGVDSGLLAKAGKITIISVPFSSRVRYDSPQEDLEREWDALDNWMGQNQGPDGAGAPFFTSEDFWWYDTNQVMLVTAYTSAAIAMGAAAAVILFSSRSFVLTMFATVTVGYVLTSVTALLVAMGWTLGFLESILFAILIGISCDFVIHFSHAYASLRGRAPRNERTRFALISMGPSILAAAFTTFAAAMVMLFTVVTFFEKFAIILFLTIAQSTLGSFLVFLVTADCIGPSDPTHLMDSILTRCYACCGKEYHSQALDETQHFTTKEFHEVDG